VAPEHRYISSLLNVSGMSYGALSDNAILALNTAAKLGNFSHNTGEGGISRFHLAPGGDIVWNIGSGCAYSNAPCMRATMLLTRYAQISGVATATATSVRSASPRRPAPRACA
jgi:hypothetical protein